MKEVNTILEMLIEFQTQLLEAKARLKEREEEIDKDLHDCVIAIAALTPKVEVAAEQPQEQTERLPKVGDEIIAICETDEFLTKGKPYSVLASSNDPKDARFVIKDDTSNAHGFSCATWRNYFRFFDEPTPEDLENLHSYLHVNSEPRPISALFEKTPKYRIKNQRELFETEGVKVHEGNFYPPINYSSIFHKGMQDFCGCLLESCETQYYNGSLIEPWMITENK